MTGNCLICSGKADLHFKRVQVWEDDIWRLTMSLYEELGGFCYLEPKGHVADITHLEGKEASTFGHVLGQISKSLKEATGAKLVYIYIFGDHISHLHVHLAPHWENDILYEDILKSGIELQLVKAYPTIPTKLHGIMNVVQKSLEEL